MLEANRVLFNQRLMPMPGVLHAVEAEQLLELMKHQPVMHCTFPS